MSKAIPFYNFHDLHDEKFQKQIAERFQEIVANNAFVDGEYNKSFEEGFADLQKTKHALLVANGTDALEIALLVHGVGHGDYVAVPGITFYATAEAVLNVGAKPIYVDVLPESGLMCPESLKRIVEKYNVSAVMPVHIYGLPAPMKEIDEICQQKNIPVIEDAAQAQGTITYAGPVGSGNNLTTFSFYPTKNLSAFGDAGAILTNNDDHAEMVKAIRNHGRSHLNVLGRNSRCDHLQAAVLDLKLKHVDDYNLKRKQVARMYFNAFQKWNSDQVRILPEHFLDTSSWHLYPIQVKDQETRIHLGTHLGSENIGYTPFYEQALNEMKVLDQFEGETEVAMDFAGRIICLPMNPFLTEDDVETVVSSLKSFFEAK